MTARCYIGARQDDESGKTYPLGWDPRHEPASSSVARPSGLSGNEEQPAGNYGCCCEEDDKVPGRRSSLALEE
jgi:hypothetical protein